jgi:hypothetical protein
MKKKYIIEGNRNKKIYYKGQIDKKKKTLQGINNFGEVSF